MPINRDGDGPPLRREDAKVPPRADDLRATPFTDDVFDDDYYGRRRGKGSSLALVAAVVVGAVVAASIGWYVFGAHESSMVTEGAGNSKLVKADPNPYKVKPDDPGGMQVDNQDKMVYERLDKGAPAKRVENLLPEPEQPKAPPLKKTDVPAETPAPQASNSAQAPASGGDDPLAKLVAKVEGVKDAPPQDQPLTPAAPVAAQKPVPAAGPMTPAAPTATPSPEEQKVAALPPEPAQPPPAAAPPPSAGQPLQLMPKQPEAAAPVAEAPAAPPAPRTEPAPTVVAPTTVATTAAPPGKPFVDPSMPPAAVPASAGPGGVYLQLASALSEEGAMSDWKRISGKNADVLGNLSPSVLPADLGGDKGMRYRLRAGPVDRTTADTLCATLRSRSVDCLVRP